MITWKNRCSHENIGIIGNGYWNAFEVRNGHLICSKSGQKYELDRDEWTTYGNFRQIYEHVYDEIEDAGIDKKLEIPEWQDENSNCCSMENFFGYQVTHELDYPEMCFVVDGVGGAQSRRGIETSGVRSEFAQKEWYHN